MAALKSEANDFVQCDKRLDFCRHFYFLGFARSAFAAFLASGVLCSADSEDQA